MLRKIIPSLLFLFAYPLHILAQVPTHIDPGQSDDAKRLSAAPGMRPAPKVFRFLVNFTSPLTEFLPKPTEIKAKPTKFKKVKF